MFPIFPSFSLRIGPSKNHSLNPAISQFRFHSEQISLLDRKANVDKEARNWTKYLRSLLLTPLGGIPRCQPHRGLWHRPGERPSGQNRGHGLQQLAHHRGLPALNSQKSSCHLAMTMHRVYTQRDNSPPAQANHDQIKIRSVIHKKQVILENITIYCSIPTFYH